jgi:hypothetical protein
MNGDYFGSAVAVSGDVAVVAASSGPSTYVFQRDTADGTWKQAAELEHGLAVAMTGQTIVIGDPSDANGVGIAHVYAFTNGAWQLAGDLMAPSSDTLFGTAVAVDGATAVVASSTTAYVFVSNGGAWTLQQQLLSAVTLDAGAAASGYPLSVALSGDTAIVGGNVDAETGAAFVFTRTGTSWSLQTMLQDNQPGDGFGQAVAFDGATLAVGAPDASNGGNAYLYTATMGTWAPNGVLTTMSGVPGSGFGASLAVKGTLLAAGGYLGLDGQGFVGTFFGTLPGGWSYGQTLGGLAVDDAFGASIAIDGTFLLAGSTLDGDAPGVAYVYDVSLNLGEACTSAAACGSGNCVDGFCCTVPACPGASECNAAETCQAGSGVCSSSPMGEGMPCDAGNACQPDAVCSAGICGSAVLCAPPDDCHEFGTCDPSSGCVNPAKPDGQPCATGTCLGGACKGSASAGAGTGGGASSGPVPLPHSDCSCRAAPEERADGGAVALALLLMARRRRAGRRLA